MKIKPNQSEVVIPLNVAATDEERRAAKDALHARQITQWLYRASDCGATSYDAKTNLGWCNCEIARLKAKRINACVFALNGFVAVFRLTVGEDVSTIQTLVDISGIDPSATYHGDNEKNDKED